MGVVPAVLKVAVDYLTLTAVNWTSPWLEQKLEVPQLLQALHVATWIIASIPFINFCHSCWMLVGEIGQHLAPSDAYQSWEYNPSPWGPVGAVIEYGLAGKTPTLGVVRGLIICTRIVGCHLAQLLQIRISVGLRPGIPALSKSQAQALVAARTSVLELCTVRPHPFLWIIHASREYAAIERAPFLRPAGSCSGVPGVCL